jgi:hypothetical protein
MDFPKKGCSVPRQKPRVKYAIMKDYLGNYSKSSISRVIGVSRSGFNKWLIRPESQSAQRKAEYSQRVKDTYEEFEAAYGDPRSLESLTHWAFLVQRITLPKS